jgi:hypothetical protein
MGKENINSICYFMLCSPVCQVIGPETTQYRHRQFGQKNNRIDYKYIGMFNI